MIPGFLRAKTETRQEPDFEVELDDGRVVLWSEYQQFTRINRRLAKPQQRIKAAATGAAAAEWEIEKFRKEKVEPMEVGANIQVINPDGSMEAIDPNDARAINDLVRRPIIRRKKEA